MRLLLARHAQTVENAENRFQGHIHGRLSALGKRQTKLLAKALRFEKIDFFFGSPLGRARETLEAVRKYHPRLQAEFDPSIIERGQGRWEERRFPEIIKEDPRVMEKLRTRTFRPGGGESLNDVRKRIRPFLNGLKKLKPEQTALVVGHGTMNGELLRLILKTETRFVQYNACINEIWLLPDGPRVVRLNDVRHLGKWVS